MKLVQYNECLVSIVDTDGLCFSTRESVATLLITQPYVSGCLRVIRSMWYIKVYSPGTYFPKAYDIIIKTYHKLHTKNKSQ